MQAKDFLSDVFTEFIKFYDLLKFVKRVLKCLS